jgi:hypothetical protein
MTTRISVVCHPSIALKMLLKDENVTMPGSYHARRGRCTRKAQPIRRQI